MALQLVPPSGQLAHASFLSIVPPPPASFFSIRLLFDQFRFPDSSIWRQFGYFCRHLFLHLEFGDHWSLDLESVCRHAVEYSSVDALRRSLFLRILLHPSTSSILASLSHFLIHLGVWGDMPFPRTETRFLSVSGLPFLAPWKTFRSRFPSPLPSPGSTPLNSPEIHQRDLLSF